MRTALVALALLAALTTSTRARAQGLGGTNVGIGIDNPAVVGLLLAPSAALTVASLAMDGVLLHQLATGKQTSRQLAVTSLIFSVLSGAWNVALLASMTAEGWRTAPGLPTAALVGLTVNVASIALSVVSLALPRSPPVVVVPLVLPSGGGASLSLRW
jgi:hypothetical protein